VPGHIDLCFFIHLNFGSSENLWGMHTNNWLSQSRQARKGLLNLFNKAIDHTGDPILHQRFTEVQKITKMHLSKAQVCEQLFSVCIVEFLNTLEFYNNFVLNNEVSPEAFIKLQPPVFDGDGNLSLNLKTSLPQLMNQDDLIDRFQ